ncbi:Wzz/FepE/Etk N-terminal domain-containing protein [Marinobacter sp. ATCH36]|uniref:Wzz/FepE/Etk N-terminal domain-containing protein n=1 Tax=Marinobacter sp. ATCH36 TaxID=2945106 RepID=UPI00202025CD|nr:Wzz/FepE/Etk N-terminal domain-containing protein [Marinobacter sp. ATCH36]MCL7945117.1 Wzz/FepE/Etk N-terminal domain-containing protein [Marinobacter sp. ATCH36]
MDNTPERRPTYDDEISLVDLATTFIRRRRVFYVVFLATTLAGLAYALLLVPEKYEYVSLYQMAEVGSGKTVEAPATTIATLQNRWFPEIHATHRQKEDAKLPFEISFSNPKDTGLIRMASEASPENAALVEETHEKLIDQIKERQQALLTREKQSLESRIDAIDRALESLQGGQDTGSAIAEAYEKRVELEGKLEGLSPGESLVVSRKSAERKGASKSLIVILAAVLGGMMGVFLAFFSEFIVLVREQLGEGVGE